MRRGPIVPHTADSGIWVPAYAGTTARYRCSAHAVTNDTAKIVRPAAQDSAVDAAQQGDEANLVVWVVAEAAGEVRRDGRGSRLLHPAHRHAHVLRLEHHRHPPRA